MRVSTKRVEEIARDDPEWTIKDDIVGLAADLLEARKLLKDLLSLPPDDWSRGQLSRTAKAMVTEYFKEEE